MLKGVDVSHWNEKEIVRKEPKDFIIIKATEGVYFKDPKMMEWVKYGFDNNLVVGLYHYARAELNSMKKEADFFVEQVHRVWDSYPSLPLFFALDWEGKSLRYGSTVALEWLKHVEDRLGTKPLFYCQQSELRKYTEIANSNFGLWVAQYNTKLGKIDPWKMYAIWQYSSANKLDKNYFNGSIEQLYKYCATDNRVAEEESRSPKNCTCCENCPLRNGK